MPSLIRLPSSLVTGELEPAGTRPGADSGNPELKIVAAQGLVDGEAGVWECRPGGWPVVNRPTTEACHILSGRATLTDSDSGETTDISAGDFVILPRGWTGRWDVQETVRKVYIIF